MGRNKSLDPASPITFTVPKSIKRMLKNDARARKRTLSAHMLEIVRAYYYQVQERLGVN